MALPNYESSFIKRFLHIRIFNVQNSNVGKTKRKKIRP